MKRYQDPEELNLSQEEFKKLLQSMLAKNRFDKTAKSLLQHIENEEIAIAREEFDNQKKLSVHELLSLINDMYNIGTLLAAKIKGLVEHNQPFDSEKYNRIYNHWYIETAYALSRYERGDSYMKVFISNADSFKIVPTKNEYDVKNLLSSLGEYTKKLIEIIQSLEQLDVGTKISLTFDAAKPQVITDREILTFTQMRYGKAFDIIDFCFHQHPNTLMSLNELQKSLAIEGVKNLNSALRKTPFDKKSGILSIFAESSPYSLKIITSRNVDADYLETLRNNALNTKLVSPPTSN
jgi:hypothetical protein